MCRCTKKPQFAPLDVVLLALNTTFLALIPTGGVSDVFVSMAFVVSAVWTLARSVASRRFAVLIIVICQMLFWMWKVYYDIPSYVDVLLRCTGIMEP